MQEFKHDPSQVWMAIIPACMLVIALTVIIWGPRLAPPRLVLPSFPRLVAVSGNALDVGIVNPDAYLSFELRGFGTDMPHVLNGERKLIVSLSNRFYQDDAGSFDGVLYRNDSIYPAQTHYEVCMIESSMRFACASVFLDSDTFDLNALSEQFKKILE